MRAKFGPILIFAFSLVVAACGGDSDTTTTSTVPSSSTTTTTSPTTSTTAPPVTTTTSSTSTTSTVPPPAIVVTSSAYGEGERIPTEFTCVGEGTQPSYTVSGLPSGTMSIAVVMEATVPQGVFTHWVQFDMPPESEIPEDAIDVGTLGSGLFGALGYAPPCPQGDAVGVYTLQVFAVDSFLGLEEGASKGALLGALEGRVIALGQLTGEYSRP